MLVLAGALGVVGTAAEAIARELVAVGEPTAAHAVRAAVAGIEARPGLADVSSGAWCHTVSAEIGVDLGVDAVRSAAL